MFTIDHLGIAVKSLTAAKSIYETLGLSISPEETVAQEKVKLVMVPLGASRLELLEATADDSPIAKFIEKKGEGVHHLAFAVSDIRSSMEDYKKKGFEVINDVPKKGADNKMICFLHPKTTGGVLIELCQDI